MQLMIIARGRLKDLKLSEGICRNLSCRARKARESIIAAARFEFQIALIRPAAILTLEHVLAYDTRIDYRRNCKSIIVNAMREFDYFCSGRR